jgi:hypothetical protein
MHRHLTTASFDPRTVAKMCAAFDLAKKAMHDCGQPELVYEILANKIIGLAREGETDPIELSKRALTGIGLPQETARVA